MPFYKWMIQYNLHEETVLGTVARFIVQNSHLFSRARSYHKSRRILESLEPSCELCAAFDQAWNEFRKFQLESLDA